MIGVLKPTLAADFHWSESDFAGIVFWFQVAYAIGYLSFGKVVDALGARLGYTIAIVIWTVSHIAHGFATGLVSFALARFGLGIGESGNFPAGIRAVTDWFPQRERAFAIGVFNAGANVGAIITPLLVPLLVLWFDWRMAFFVTGLFGILAAGLVAALSPPGTARPGEPGGTGLDPPGSGRSGRADRLGAAAHGQGNLGLCAGQVPDRPDLVVLPVLAAGLSVHPL
jgi:ACS family hexuronate transporter-like MFS transporter